MLVTGLFCGLWSGPVILAFQTGQLPAFQFQSPDRKQPGTRTPDRIPNGARRLVPLVLLILMHQAVFAGSPVTDTDAGRAVVSIDLPEYWSLRTGGLRDFAGPEAEGVRDVSRVFDMTPEAHEGI